MRGMRGMRETELGGAKEIVAKRRVEVYKRSVSSERAEASGAVESGSEMRLADRTWQFKLTESTRGAGCRGRESGLR